MFVIEAPISLPFLLVSLPFQKKSPLPLLAYITHGSTCFSRHRNWRRLSCGFGCLMQVSSLSGDGKRTIGLAVMHLSPIPSVCVPRIHPNHESSYTLGVVLLIGQLNVAWATHFTRHKPADVDIKRTKKTQMEQERHHSFPLFPITPLTTRHASYPVKVRCSGKSDHVSPPGSNVVENKQRERHS